MSIVQRYIEADYPVFQASEKVSDALAQLEELRLQEVPVLHDGKLLGLLRPDDVSEVADGEGDREPGLRLDQVEFDESERLCQNEHILDVFERLNDNSANRLLPVTDQDGTYEGVVFKSDLLREIALLFHFSETGSTLEIEAPALSVKVSEIIGVIEKNDAMVLSFGVIEPEPGAQTMVMTFRVQSPDVYRLVANLEKYGYLIRYARPSADGGVDELREKALEFMRYIDM